MGQTVCPETLVRNHCYTLRCNPEERRTHSILYHFFLSVSKTNSPGIESESPAPPSVVTMLGVAKWRKATISFDRCPPAGMSLLPPNEFSWNLKFETYIEVSRTLQFDWNRIKIGNFAWGHNYGLHRRQWHT